MNATLEPETAESLTPAQVEGMVDELPLVLARLEMDPSMRAQLGPQVVAQFEGIQGRLNLDMTALQLADFLKGFEARCRLHRAYYDQLFHDQPMDETI